MSTRRTHFGDTFNGVTIVSCGRSNASWSSGNWRRVDCERCKATPAYAAQVEAHKAKVEADFQAQTPRTIVPQFGRVNDQGVMECYKCQGVLFRERPRSLFSYHYVCEGCGTSMHPLTETGMST
jgi:hypothetical protein